MFDFRLYLITDGLPDLARRVEEAIQGGVTVVQYREKKKTFSEMVEEAISLKEVCHRHGVPLFINDFPEVAKAAGADGLHLGQNDLDIQSAKAILGDDFPIGMTAKTPTQAQAAQSQGAVYVGVGAVFPTDSKSDATPITLSAVLDIQKSVQIPVLLIGGVNEQTVPKLTVPYDGLCVISGVLGDKSPRLAAERLRELMSFSRGLKSKAQKVWEAGYQHPFVQEIGQGTLDLERFKFYLLQDYLYLIQYAKVFALGALKADTVEVMRYFSDSQYFTVNRELSLHEKYMEQFGISQEEVEQVKASLYNSAYTANMLAQGQTGGLAELIAAVFPCAWTYADYGQRLKRQYGDLLADNPYASWIEMYASESFEASFQWFYETLDRLVSTMSEKDRMRIEEIFIQSVEFEYLFWEMAYHMQLSF